MKRFRTTPWSLILTAQRRGEPESAEALNELCQIYWFPLYGFVRRRGYSVQDAENLTQGFFTSLFEKNFVEFVDRTRGRFRSFMLTALSHYLSDEWDRSQAAKRGGHLDHISLDIERAEVLLGEIETKPLTPEELYDRDWAKTLMAAALGDVRQEYARRQRGELMSAIEGHVVAKVPGRPYRIVAEELGMTENGVSTAVRRLRQDIGAAIRDRIAKTLEDSDEVDQEMRYLLELL